MRVTIGEILKSLRESKNLTMHEMSNQLMQYGMCPSKSTISRWESGKSEPSMEYARILSKYFMVPFDFLLDLDDSGHSNIRIIAARVIDELTDEEQVELINYAKYIKSKRDQGK